ncbi:hypothetical protein HG536_0F04220 [Torulaspora globosa]|uniref:Uncharacterized protein n=1 Tax=Torulaspora globosa TaxID=48254 RepID=A0A7G3ZKR0_9SACH|nr:uncharacterized protein HG536_0F04220 [Torulaspora globosa]QLL34096.1 hypothetical protein HG536_0F04220 [Torulaspora globosa]
MMIDNSYYLAHSLEQLKPQRLSGNIFFGPLNTLTQRQFIESENIKLFIGVGLSTRRLAPILNEIPSFAGKLNDYLVLNFDSEFDAASIISGSAGSAVEEYHSHNSTFLKLIIENFLKGNEEFSVQEGYRCLTPTPETLDFAQIIDGDVEAYYNGGNVYSDPSSSKFVAFNDFIAIFKRVNPTAKVLVFSQNGNDLELVTFLVSAVLKEKPSVKVREAYQFIKSIRPTINDSLGKVSHGCSALSEFHQLLLAKEQLAAQQGYTGCNQTPQVLRKRNNSILQGGTPEPADEQVIGSKRIRFD